MSTDVVRHHGDAEVGPGLAVNVRRGTPPEWPGGPLRVYRLPMPGFGDRVGAPQCPYLDEPTHVR